MINSEQQSNRTTSQAHTAEDPAPKAGPETNSTAWQQRFVTPFVDFASQYQDAQVAVQSKCDDALTRCAEGLKTLDDDLRQRTAAVYDSYQEAASRDKGPNDAVDRVIQAHREYLEVLQAVWSQSESQKVLADSYLAYQKAILESSQRSEGSGDANAAYTEYMKGLQEAVQMQANSQQRLVETQKKLIEAQQEASAGLSAEMLNAYQEYLSGLKQVWDDVAVEKRYRALMEAYQDDLAKAWSQYHKDYRESVIKALDGLRSAWAVDD
jgi:hypothetical protein